MHNHDTRKSDCTSLQAAYRKLGKFSALLGTYHKEANHWMLVFIDLVKRELLYIDPWALENEHTKAEEFADHWME